MLHVDRSYTQEELRSEYAQKARTMFDNHQKWRSRYSRWNSVLLFAVMVLGVLSIKFEWCLIALLPVIFVTLVSRLNERTVSHALSAMNCLRHAQTFEHMSDFDELSSAIEAFEVSTLHD